MSSPEKNEITNWRPTINNRIWNCKNPHQGESKRVLCVCSAGLLRSPTAAVVLASEPYNYNTRAAGAEESFALVPVDDVLLQWADEVVCMTEEHKKILEAKWDVKDKKITVLGIPDNFPYRDPTLMRLIRESYDEKGG